MGSKRPPPDLPGMYYDTERNRYFPLKSRRPTNKNSQVKSSAEQLHQAEELARSVREDAILHKRRIPNTVFAAMDKSEDGNAVLRLLHQRELAGHNWKKKSGTNSSAFERQMLESHTGLMSSGQRPKIWTYESVHCDGGIEQCRLDIQTAAGQVEVDAMVAGGFNEVQTLQVCGPEDAFVWGDELVTSPNDLFPCPHIYENLSRPKSAILRPVFVKLPFTSMITSVKKFNECSEQDNITQNVILTTLGNGGEGGSIFLMRDKYDVFCESSRPFSRRLRVQINSDIYTAECRPRRKEVSLGLKAGAAILDIERSEVIRIFFHESSVLAQQFDNSGNLLFCGHRNGMIIANDLRLYPPATLQTRHRHSKARQPKVYEEREICPKLDRQADRQASQFVQSGPSCMELDSDYLNLVNQILKSGDCILSPEQNANEVSCLQVGSYLLPYSCMSLLRSNEHYLIASAMDGQIWQCDVRMAGRGPVQTFEGHVNTHSLLQLRLDPSERLLASGGTDGALRLWSVKSGRLLHVERKTGCVPKRICWNTSSCRSSVGRDNAGRWGYFEEPRFEDDSPWALWTGSTALLHMRGGHGT